MIGPRPPHYTIAPQALEQQYGVTLPPGGVVKRRVRLSGTATVFGVRFDCVGTYKISMMAATRHPEDPMGKLFLWSDTLAIQINP